MKLGFILSLLFFVCGCGGDFFYTSSEKERLSNEVIRKAAKQIREETGLIPCGTGGGALDQIRMLAISFDYKNELDIDSSRKLLIAATEKFVSIVNSDEKIRSYLINYPFQVRNVEMRIFIQKKDGSNLEQGKLVVISVTEGVLKYKVNAPDGWGLDTIYQETYEEALQKLNEMETACF